MAINIPFPIFGGTAPPPPPLVFDRARPEQPLPEVPQQPPAGSLVIIDGFQNNYDGEAAHGNVGAFAARQQGFRGNIYAENIGPDQPAGMAQSVAARSLLNFPQSPEFTRQAVQDYARFDHRELLEDVTGDLNKLSQRGLHDSAVNISYGTSPVRDANRLLNNVREGTDPLSPYHQMSQNILQAYSIDGSKLSSQDPNVSGPERHRLHQALLESAERGVASPDVQQAQSNYDQAVTNLQSRNNSVVVSAGNDQQVADQWKAEAGGLAPQGGPNMNHNPLANAQVTTVGATRWTQGANGLRESAAGYSNRDPEVDIYASGAVGNGLDVNRMQTKGTSFAAPRVAATLATLHGTHPGASASQMRNLMQNRLTHSLNDGQQSLSVLDFKETELYMRRGTFQ